MRLALEATIATLRLCCDELFIEEAPKGYNQHHLNLLLQDMGRVIIECRQLVQLIKYPPEDEAA